MTELDRRYAHLKLCADSMLDDCSTPCKRVHVVGRFPFVMLHGVNEDGYTVSRQKLTEVRLTNTGAKAQKERYSKWVGQYEHWLTDILMKRK